MHERKRTTVSVVGFKKRRIKDWYMFNIKWKSSETQKIGPEQPIITATMKKSKRARYEISHIEENIQKLKRQKQSQKMDFLKK